MRRKTIISFIVIISLLFFFVWFPRGKQKEDTTLFIEQGLENVSTEGFLRTDFEQNEAITVGQSLVFYNRYTGNNAKNYNQVKDYCLKKNVLLPSDLIYNTADWEILWRDMVLGNTLFEKEQEGTYSIVLIPKYLKIYLNEQGYNLIKKGSIPPHLYFYSPFSNVSNLEEINLNKNATMGFICEVLMNIEYSGQQDRKSFIKDIIIDKVEQVTGKSEKDWTANEIDLYNYYALSYYGQYSYLASKGILNNVEFSDLGDYVSLDKFLEAIKNIEDSKL